MWGLRKLPISKIKKILHPYINHARKLKIKPVIRRYDKDVHVTSWPGASFHEAYFVPFDIPPPAEFSAQGVVRSNVIDAKVAEVASKVIADFGGFIKDYLGENVRLDDIYMFWFDPDKVETWSLSNSWHDDNVGSRIKVFVCFNGNGTTPTVVVPGSHNFPYSPRKEEISRFSGVRNTQDVHGQVELRYKSGDLAMFDTSCLHRGLYEQPSAKRTVLVLEFIDRHKSNRIVGYAPCGPGMSKVGEVHFDEVGFKLLNKTGMIDENLVSFERGKYVYSLKNSKK
ncbi:hypothetical protein ACIKP7_20790 [Pseudomonas caricapapayae]|uniref:Uncharacterized protein n=1 Tax=Pseudomonas caricapapayae TaxID=46678 RepID=A0ACC7M1E0_9PSED